MVKQGDIIKINMNPQLGSEQAGYRPAVVVSNNRLNKISKIVMICPITNTKRNYPTHVQLPVNLKISGEIMCEQIKAVDITIRPYEVVSHVESELMDEVIETIHYVTERI